MTETDVLRGSDTAAYEEGDDTQVAPTQEYVSHHELSRSPRIQQSTSQEIDTGPKTYQSEDPGYIRLAGSIEDDTQVPGPMEYDGNQDTQGTYGEVTQIDMDAVTSPSRFPCPESFAGQKRDFRGNFVNNVLSPQPRTPLVNLAGLSFLKERQETTEDELNRLFQHTQANTSPPGTVTRSDPIFERPSPDFRPAASSQPQRTLSSPIRRDGESSTPLQGNKPVYVSMYQSQENRKRRQSMHEQSSSPVSVLDDDEEEDELGDDSMGRRAAKQKEKARMEQEAKKQFATLGTSLSRNASFGQRSHSRSKSETINLITPVTAKRKSDVIYISDDIREEEEDLADGAVSPDAESVDEYDELSQAIIPTSDKPDRCEDVLGPTPVATYRKTQPPLSRSASSPIQPRHFQSPISGHVRRTFPEPLMSQSMAVNSISRMNNTRSFPRIAVVNSQPDGMPVSRLPMPSSIDSRGFISESQSLGLTISSGTRAELSMMPFGNEPVLSSIPPPPVLSSQTSRASRENEDEERREDSPASSPPPQIPQSSKDAGLERRSRDATQGSANAEIENMQDKVDLLSSEEAAPNVVGGENQQDTLSDAAQSPARLSNRKRHQIPDSSGEEVSAGRTNDVSAAHQTKNHVPAHAIDHQQAPAEASMDHSGRTDNNESNDTTEYQTAPTYQSAPEARQQPAVQSTPPQPQPINPFLRMTEIAMQASPEKSSAEFDISRINIMNEDDLAFEAMVAGSSPASPPRKRPRRTYGRRGMNTSPREEKEPPLKPALKAQRNAAAPTVATFSVQTPVARPPMSPVPRPTVSPISPRQSTGRLKRIERRNNSDISAAPTPARSVVAPSSRLEVTETPQSDLQVAHTIEEGSEVAINTEEEQIEEREEGTVPGNARSDEPEDVQMVDMPEVSDIGPAPFVPDPVATPIPAQDSRVSNRVLARFSGTKMAFYPATCLGPVRLGSSVYRVRFDDGAIAEIEAHLVRRFELHVGEVVRVDLPKLRTGIWTIKGFLDPIEDALLDDSNEENLLTDVRGFKTVQLEARQRKSLPAAEQLPQAETINVGIASLYLTLQMWNQLKNRGYKHPQAVVPSNRLATPFNIITMPSTPPSRTRRKTIGEVQSVSRTISLGSEAQSGLFANMAFAITYPPDKDAYRNRVSRLILNNGGSILSDGFDELFEPIASLPTTPMTPSKPDNVNSLSIPTKLKLSPQASKLGFTALIADAHCRKAKYMQALALNIPCLSGRWIVDCIARGKLLLWHKYLLPAGESTFLHGAIRSRTFTDAQMASNNPCIAKLADVVEQRPKLAEGKGVILVTGSSKMAEEKRKPYLFLICALGAKRVEKVKDVSAAKALLENGEAVWDWVYVDETKVGKMEERLGLGIGGGIGRGGGNGKKRKRGDGAEVGKEMGERGVAKVINDEFVVQSLILGALVEDPE